MKNKFCIVEALFSAASSLLPPLLVSQSIDLSNSSNIPGMNFPISEDETFYTIGAGASLAVDFDVLPLVSTSLDAGHSVQPVFGNTDLSIANIGTGLFLNIVSFLDFESVWYFSEACIRHPGISLVSMDIL